MLTTVIEKYNSTLNANDNVVTYLADVDLTFLNFLEKYPEILNNKFILLKHDEFNFYDSIDFEDVKSVINLKPVNHNPGFNNIFKVICSHLTPGAYYAGLYHSFAHVLKRIYTTKSLINCFFQIFYILIIGCLGIIPFIRNFKYLKDRYYSYSYMSSGLNKLFVNSGMMLIDKLSTNSTTYFILIKT